MEIYEWKKTDSLLLKSRPRGWWIVKKIIPFANGSDRRLQAFGPNIIAQD